MNTQKIKLLKSIRKTKRNKIMKLADENQQLRFELIAANAKIKILIDAGMNTPKKGKGFFPWNLWQC